MTQTYKIGSGLSNLGNTCFFNAAMQTILYTKPLYEYLETKAHSEKCRKKDWCVFCQLERMHFETQRNKVYSPVSMIKNLKNVFKKFKLGRQQDSHEFLRYFIEGLQEVEHGPLSKQMSREDKEKAINKTKTYHIFGGLMRTSIHCLNCNQRSLTQQRFYDMNLQCQISSKLISGLDKFFQADDLSGSNKYNCEFCKSKSNAKKRFHIIKSPLIMTFQFKRFTNSLRKIGKYIEFPQKINISKYLQQQRKVIMDLYAIIVHAGGTSWSGHYYAFVKVGENWYKMDDSHVTRVSQDSVFSQHAYLIFYRKIFDQKIEQKKKQKQQTLIKQQYKNGIFNANSDKKAPTISSTGDSPGQIMTKDLLDGYQSSKNQNIDKKQKKKQKKAEKKKKKALQKQKKIQKETQLQQNTVTNTKEVQEKIPEKQEDDSLSLEVPGQLGKRRSKQQANRQTPLALMLIKYALNQLHLKSKLRQTRYRSLDHLRNLRKFQITMKQKKIK